MTSVVNQVRRHTGRNCSMVTSCHRNVPAVEKLRGREKEDGRGRETAASKSREASRRRKRAAVLILVR